MSTTRRRSRRRRLVALSLAVGLVVAACSSDDDSGTGSTDTTTASSATGDLGQNVPVDEPGVTDSAINFSVLGTETGNPFGTCLLQCFTDGIEAYFEYRNSESDGIYGRELKATRIVDDEFSKNQEKALEIIADEDSFGVFGDATLPTGYQTIADEGIPLYVWASQPAAMQGQEGIFGEVTVRCLAVGCWDRSVPYEMKLSGRMKLATMGYGIAQSSKDCAQNQAQSVEQMVDMVGAGAEAVYTNDELPFGLPNGVAPEVTAMKNAGANILATCIVNSDSKTILQEAKRQSLDIVPVIPQGYDQDTLDQMGQTFEGGYIRNTIRSFEADLNEAQEKYLEYTEKDGGKVQEVSIYGWINAALAVKGLELAGPDFDQQKVIDATNTLTAFTADGLTPPMNWTTGHKAPTPTDTSYNNEFECYSISKIENSKFVLQGPKDAPFTCWPGTDDWKWTEGWPQQKSFD